LPLRPCHDIQADGYRVLRAAQAVIEDDRRTIAAAATELCRSKILPDLLVVVRRILL